MTKDNNEISKSRITVVSFGGCVMDEICKRLNPQYFNHVNHYWRRSTIALMSEPIDYYNFKTSSIPNRFISYFVNDVTGFHLKELEKLDRNTLIVIDIMRDLFVGVVKIGENKYALNPVDGIGLLDDVTPETMSNEILCQILRTDTLKTIHPIRDADEYFELWCIYMKKLCDFLAQKFEHVVLPENYFAEKTLELHDGHSLDVERAHAVNAVAKRMYAWLKENTDIKIASINNDRIFTGSDVPWGGPETTHIIEETYALYCQEVDKIVLKRDSHDSRYLEDAAFQRAHQHAHEQKHKLRAQNRVQELEAELASLRETTEALQQQNSDLSACREIIAQLKSELRRPARYHLKKILARSTRRLRGRH